MARTLSAYRQAILNHRRAEKTLDGLKAAPKELAAVLGQVTGALRALIAAEPPIVKLLAAPQWEAAVSELEKVLRPHPEIARKVREVFERLDAEALADIKAALGPE